MRASAARCQPQRPVRRPASAPAPAGGPGGTNQEKCQCCGERPVSTDHRGFLRQAVRSPNCAVFSADRNAGDRPAGRPRRGPRRRAASGGGTWRSGIRVARMPIPARDDHRPYSRSRVWRIMFQVRIHGRGGQGVVTAAELLSVAAFREGRHAQAFPSFGSERKGAPVVAFCRIDDRPIRLREPVLAPDAIIIQDPTLLHQVDVFGGLAPDGYILINTSRHVRGTRASANSWPASAADRCARCPRPRLALKHIGRPLPNAALLGGFAALSGGSRSSPSSPRSARSSRRRSRRRTWPPPTLAYRLRVQREAGGRPCSSRLKARRQSPKPWRCAARR